MNSYYINATQKDTLSLFYHTIKERVHCIYRDGMFPPCQPHCGVSWVLKLD